MKMSRGHMPDFSASAHSSSRAFSSGPFMGRFYDAVQPGVGAVGAPSDVFAAPARHAQPNAQPRRTPEGPQGSARGLFVLSFL
jgi:hypothetical protein